MKDLTLIKYSSKFVFIDRRSWNGECPELWFALVFELTRARLSTLKQGQAPSSILLKVFRSFKEGQNFDLLI